MKKNNQVKNPHYSTMLLYLKSIDGKSNQSQIYRKSGLALAYGVWFEKVGLVERVKTGRQKKVILTERGKIFLDILCNLSIWYCILQRCFLYILY